MDKQLIIIIINYFRSAWTPSEADQEEVELIKVRLSTFDRFDPKVHEAPRKKNFEVDRKKCIDTIKNSIIN